MNDRVGVNQSSDKAVEQVLKEINKHCGVVEKTGTRSRTWTVVGCDGLPYVLGSCIIQRTPVDLD